MDGVYNNLLIDIFGVALYPSALGYGNVMSYPMGMLGTVSLGRKTCVLSFNSKTTFQKISDKMIII